jgi:hypothetical protein
MIKQANDDIWRSKHGIDVENRKKKAHRSLRTEESADLDHMSRFRRHSQAAIIIHRSREEVMILEAIFHIADSSTASHPNKKCTTADSGTDMLVPEVVPILIRGDGIWRLGQDPPTVRRVARWQD